MKIVQIVSYYPPHLGGMENAVKEISENLAKRGHQVEVFTSDIGCKKGKLRSTKNLKIHYLKSWESAHTPIIPSLFFKLLKISKDSIMHVHIAQALVPEVVYLVSKIKKIPYIVHIHLDVGPSGKLGILLPLYKRIFLKRVLKSASKIVILNRKYRILINRDYNIFKNIVIIPNGVSKKFFINKKNTKHEQINLLFVGRLSIQKNIPKLIKAASLLKSKAILNIVGDGEKKIEIEKYISSNNLKNVILHGKKIGKDLINFYQNADIFLLASDYEGLPLVLLEAMASGTPIIASDVIGIREIIGEAGILINPPTSENFAREIDKLIENKKIREKLAEKGRKKANNYDWSKIAKKFEDVYENVKEAKLK
jgi:glycosyltransferase involved in cell wall biosynthesis